MSDFRAELMAAFAAEYREHLAAIREALSREDAGGGVTLDAAQLREAFRRAHSLKGAARASARRIATKLATVTPIVPISTSA